MDWDAIGAVAEALGATGVIGTLFYLAIQIQKQTRESSLIASRELANQSRALFAALASDGELTRIYREGLHDYEGMSGDERYRCSYVFSQWMMIAEQQFMHNQDETIERDYYTGAQNTLRGVIVFPGFQQWFSTSKDYISPEFYSYIEEMSESSDRSK
jgi:hypothetical protein